MTIIDLTHEINNETPIYPGSHDIRPQFTQSTNIKADGYTSSMVTMSLHIGTHIDAPAHMLPDGATLDMIPLEQLCCPAHLVDARDKCIIDVECIEPVVCSPRGALLIATGWDKYWGTPEYFTEYPVLSEKAVEAIIAKKIGLVGIDTPSPDPFPFTLHRLLFRHKILIIENMTQVVKLINRSSIMLYALPLKCKTDGAPARVIAVIP